MTSLPELQTVDDYETARFSKKIVVIFFSVTWCPPCKRVAPFVAKLPEMFPECGFYKIDRDNDELLHIYKQCGLSSVPSFVVFVNGVPKEFYDGENKDRIEKLIRKYI